MKLIRIFAGLAPALAIAALIGFASPAPSRADEATPTPAAAATPAARCAGRGACAPPLRPLRRPPLPRPPRRPPARRLS